MNINEVKQAKTAQKAYQYAIEWQQWASDENLSYGEIAEWGQVFEELATKFDLIEEFKENGII